MSLVRGALDSTEREPVNAGASVMARSVRAGRVEGANSPRVPVMAQSLRWSEVRLAPPFLPEKKAEVDTKPFTEERKMSLRLGAVRRQKKEAAWVTVASLCVKNRDWAGERV